MRTLPETAAGKPRIEWMDALRGMAILLVVLDHSLVYMHKGGYWPVPGLDVLSDTLNPVRMPAMAFLSGLLLAPSLAKAAGAYVRGKLGNVIWPLVVWSVIYKLVWIAAEPFTGTPHDLSDLATMLIAPEGHLWFLRDLFLFYMLHLALAQVRVPRVPLLLGIAALGIVLCALYVAENNNGQWQRFWFLFAFFTLGGLLSERRGWFETLMRKPATRAAALALTLAMVPATLALGNIRYEWISTPFTLGGIGTLALLAQAACRTPLSAPLRFIGRNSLMVYVGHWLIVAVTAMAMQGLAPDLHPTLMALVVLGSGIGLSVLGIHVVQRVPALQALFSFPKRRRPQSPALASKASMSSSEKPKWWPTSWMRT